MWRVAKRPRGELNVTTRDRTRLTDLLGQDHVGPKTAQKVRVNVIEAGAPMPVAGGLVDLFARHLAWVDRDRVQGGQTFHNVSRPVRVGRDADELVFEPEQTHDFCSRRQ